MKVGLLLLCLVAARADEAKLYVQLGHSWWIGAVAFSHDGRFVVTGSSDRTARLWDAATGSEIRKFQGHSDAVTSVAFSADDRFLLTGSNDNTARLWDMASGVEIRRFEGHSNSVSSIAFSPDGHFVLTGSGDKTARLWDAITGAEVRRFQNHASQVDSVAYSPDGRFVLLGSEDKTARLLDAATGAEIREFQGHAGSVTAVRFSPDGRFVITGSHDKTARIWDTASGAVVKELRHSDQVLAIEYSPDGHLLATGSGKTVHLWDAASLGELRQFHRTGSIWSIAFSPDGRSLLASGGDNAAWQWDVAGGAEVRRYEGHSDSVTSVAFSPLGHLILTGSSDSTARLWDLESGVELRALRGHTASVTSVAFSPDGRVVLTGSKDKTARLWDAANGKELTQFRAGDDEVASVAFSADGRFVITGGGGADHIARLWDVASGTEIRRFEGHSDQVPSVAISPDGRMVATAGYEDHTARLWDMASGVELHQLRGSFSVVFAVAFSPDGQYLLTGSQDSTARLWDLSGKELRQYPGGSEGVLSVKFSPDGRSVLAGNWDGTARIFDTASGALLHEFGRHDAGINSVAFSPDGRFVATGSEDGTVRMWQTATGKWLATLVSSREGGWAVVDPDGRFDTSDLDGGAPLHWSLDSEPTRPYPLEIFMRDYYTPRLLTRVLKGEKLPPVPRIADIRNRVQPEVAIVKIEPSTQAPDRLNVSVLATGKTERDQASGLQDLRLFRNGQMVGYLAGTLKDGRYVFRNIQLSSSQRNAAFTAYAFNSARIKSATVHRDFAYSPRKQHAKPKAYLVQIGVNHYQASDCELRFAVNDARKLSEALGERLAGRELRKHELVATAERSTAGKEQIRATLADIAKEATPDDALFLSFSGHGYTSGEGEFYILPADIQGSCRNPDRDLLKNAISADELADWLRPVDAGEMTFILDSCYSARSVEANGFKPGPMGSRGLGQLAYDKRMRILAGSQSDQQAREDSAIQQGLLSYVLTEKGLREGKADWRPVDKQITVGEWLAYAADQVPKLDLSTLAKDNGRGVKLPPASVRPTQSPALFDFAKKDDFVIQR